ncbi:MAG: hypothetical protein AAF465_11015 [Pseudomonadota bacterium]
MPDRPIDRFNTHLPLLVFLLPVVSINAAYLTASVLDHIPLCVPYFSGCTSISSAGRVMPQKGIFLLGMIPAAILTMQLWLTSEGWLTGNQQLVPSRGLAFTGALASFCLLVYVTTLGIPGDVYRLFRKFGVLLYFGCTFIAQLLLIRQLKAHNSAYENHDKLAKRLTLFCVGILLCGIVIVPISLVEDPIKQKQMENIVEWNYALLLHVYYLLLIPAWRRMAMRHDETTEPTHGT